MQKRFGLLFLFLPVLLTAAEKRAFQISDLYALKSISDLQIAPDGRHLLFVVGTQDLAKSERNSDIWIMAADGSGLRQLTFSPGGDYQPRWSPDGRQIAFLSGRASGTQIWLLPVDGGEARRVTDLAITPSDLKWLPDGSGFLFTSEVFPECGADDHATHKILETMEKGPVQAHLADRLFYRHWTWWRDGRVIHTFRYALADSQLTDLTPGAIDRPADAGASGTAGYSLSPDGRTLCLAVNPDRNDYETTDKDLWLQPLGGGDSLNITADNPAYDAEPAWSPDGRYIAYILQEVPGYESDRKRLALHDRQTGERRILTEAFDFWVGTFQWAADSRSLYFTADVQGHVPLYQVDVQKGTLRRLLDLKSIDNFQIAPDGRSVFCIRRSVGEPAEIWRASLPKGDQIRRLTAFNQPIAEAVDIRPAEELWIASPTGKRIHTFVVKPHNFDPVKKYPLILNVHGGPQMQWADAFRGDWQVYPGAGYVVAFPNPHGSTGYGQEFTLAISKDWGGKVFEDVMAVTDSLARLPYIDAGRLGAMGWSYGGYMMMWLEGHTDRFKAIAAMMGVYDLPAMYGATEELWFPEFDLGGTPWQSPLYDTLSPHIYAARFKTPCLVITGEKDFRVPYTQSLEFFTALQKQGVPSRLIVFENDGHWPDGLKSMPLYYTAHLDWFHRYLGGDPAPWDVEKMVRNQIFD
ncbi:MAG TPA: S9 family peptidase [bacterium]|nr:S9 family peptidase [bacterium]HQG46341.1 S9 family peptidase [bacterium]HQI49994.1 S9 family peptidase [bacterium]HQJ65640.1 S9 family peptidase [bacterium]